ncbi:NAD(P)/FAD-dependent oxidoreductase [Streptomyces sp. HF10]|uniref:NAD(P)/FAD-dependent oxidoreductase n=1 Tax=Streptomyces sp. HF10 TaxID=2692233 RepID=UPI0013197A95|nr:NAD(P)/FAD-dependent oxidoreductase [Streptomyces sp. HF10]QHC31832.1 FAD-dependent oxidoreductase [Streptomyces sp. HF10]
MPPSPSIPSPQPYDVVVVGAGAAGLSAAVLLGRSKRRILVLSLPTRRNSPAEAVRNVPFAHGMSPAEVYAKMEADAASYGVRFLWDEAVSARFSDDDEYVVVETGASGPVTARRLLLAAGTVNELPPWLPDGVWGKTVFDCPYCHTYEHSGKHFVSLGAGEEALKHSLLCRPYAKGLTTLVRDPAAAESGLADRLREHGCEVLVDTVGKAERLPSGELALTTEAGRTITTGVVVLDFVIRPNQRLPRSLGLELNAHGYPRATLFGQTSHRLVYSAGNAPGSPYFMWTGAACSGINAARKISEDMALE